MNNMRAEFEASVAGSSGFIYIEKENSYIHKSRMLSRKEFRMPKDYFTAIKERDASLERFNEHWFYWQHAWKSGAQEPQLSVTDLSDDVLNAILADEYSVEDYQRGEGIVYNREQLLHNFVSMETGRFVLRTAFAAYKRIMNK